MHSRLMTTALSLFCVAMLLLAAASPAYAAEVGIERMRDIYEKELTKIEESQRKELGALQDQHAKAMSALAEKMQNAGQLDPFLAIQKEHKRFIQEKVVDDVDMGHGVVGLRKLQASYLASLVRMPLSKAEKVINLVQQYSKTLSDLQKTYTKNNRIADAIQVKDERDAIENKPEVMEARFVIADAETKAIPVRIVPEKQPKTPAPRKSEETDEPAKKYTGSDKNRVRKRYLKFIDEVVDQDYSSAVEYIDPDYRVKKGVEATTLQMKMLFPFVRMMTNPRVKHSVDEIRMEEDGQTATLIPKLWMNNKWHPQKSVEFLYADGDWYLSMTAAREQQQQREQQRNRRDRHRGRR